MTKTSKILKICLEVIQFNFGIIGGLIYYLLRALSLIIKPLKAPLTTYSEGAPILSTLMLSIIATLLIYTVFLVILVFQPGFSFESAALSLLFILLFIMPWVFLSLDLFAYYKRFRIDRKR